MQKKNRMKRAIAITALGVALATPGFAQKTYASSGNATNNRHFTRSFAVKNGLVHHHRNGHKLSHSHKKGNSLS